MTSLVVFTWSRSFETLWPDLATALGVALDLCVAEPGALPEWSSREDAVLLCAAGGMETDASAALERMTIGARLAIVGAVADQHREQRRQLRGRRRGEIELSDPRGHPRARTRRHAEPVAARHGRVRRARLTPDPMRNALAWIARYRKFWELELDLLARYLESLPSPE